MMPEYPKSVPLPLFLFLILLFHGPPLVAQEQGKDQKVEEYVEVINAEVLVRALDKGRPVGGLTENDFSLYGNGEKHSLTSFSEIRRKIDTGDSQSPGEEKVKILPPKRFFFLYFRITDPLTQYHEALDFFFNHIYRNGDYILILVENIIFKITRREEIETTLPAVKNEIDKKARQAELENDRMLQRVQLIVRTFEQLLRQIETRAGGERRSDPHRKKYFFENLKRDYTALWDEYRYEHIHLDTARLKAIAASLKTVKYEKWGLVFYQHDTFPQLNPESIFVEKHSSVVNLQQLRRMIAEISMEMKRPKILSPNIEEVRQAFVDADTTFHLLLCQPKKMGRTVSQYLTIGQIHSDRQEAFKGICTATGGKIIDKTDLKESLKKVANTEDIYYRLTYAPNDHGPSDRQIEVKTTRNNLELVYCPEITVKKANQIAVDSLFFSHPNLDFVLTNFQQLFDGTQLSGDVEVKVTIIDKKGTMLSINRSFAPKDVGLMVSLKLNFPHSGKYSLIVEALDKQTGKTATVSQKVNVPKLPGEIDPKTPVLLTRIHEKSGGVDHAVNLDILLDRAASYCRKLSKATFYFTCTEEIVDTYTIKGKQIKEDIYSCNYQIVMDADGKMSERRILVNNHGDEKKEKKKRKKKKKTIWDDKEILITNFFSNYPFLLPVTLLSRENQDNYRYQLLTKENINGRFAYKISVNPKHIDSNKYNHGVVWIDATDGSIVKIELNPRAIRGIEKLQGRARRKGTFLKIVDVHWYEVKKKGIRFPSGTEITETYIRTHLPVGITNGPFNYKTLEEAKTVFSYKKYRFFNVNVNVIDTGHS